MERREMVETTLGDLIVALTEEAAYYIHDEKEAYKVVAFMLTNLLRNPTGCSNRGNTAIDEAQR